jgi:hypothetical protein
LKRGTWQGKEMCGIIRTQAVNHASIHDCSQDAGKTAVDAASDGMVMGAMRVFCEFSLLVGQQNHSDLSLKALDDALKRLDQMKGVF